MPHVALLGDSIFDNASYTSRGPAVIDLLRRQLPRDWTADLLAVDGATIRDVPGQLSWLADHHTHLVLSAGGNDALMRADLLDTPVRSSGEAMLLLARATEEFARVYRSTVAGILDRGRPLVLCTIYEGNFPVAEFQAAVRTALCGFNDVIIRTAMAHSLRVIELREVCHTPEDYANPIEPSVVGGGKIARAIVSALLDGRPAGSGATITA